MMEKYVFCYGSLEFIYDSLPHEIRCLLYEFLVYAGIQELASIGEECILSGGESLAVCVG